MDIKVQKIVNIANQLLVKTSVYITELASFIGLLVNAFQAVLEGPIIAIWKETKFLVLHIAKTMMHI